MMAQIDTPSSAAFALGPWTNYRFSRSTPIFNGLSMPEIMWIQKVSWGYPSNGSKALELGNLSFGRSMLKRMPSE
jgi:hypothetical protein